MKDFNYTPTGQIAARVRTRMKVLHRQQRYRAALIEEDQRDLSNPLANHYYDDRRKLNIAARTGAIGQIQETRRTLAWIHRDLWRQRTETRWNTP